MAVACFSMQDTGTATAANAHATRAGRANTVTAAAARTHACRQRGRSVVAGARASVGGACALCQERRGGRVSGAPPVGTTVPSLGEVPPSTAGLGGVPVPGTLGGGACESASQQPLHLHDSDMIKQFTCQL